MPEAMKISSLILCVAAILVAAPVSFTPAFAEDDSAQEQPASKKGKKGKKKKKDKADGVAAPSAEDKKDESEG